MSQGKVSHIHTYERSIRSKNTYRCIDPECSHFHTAEFLIGKKALCAKCHQPFLLERWMLIGKMSVKTPLCLSCGNSKKARMHQKLAGTVEDLLAKMNLEEI